VEPRQPAQIVRELLEAFRRGDYEAALAAYDAEVEGDFTHLADGRLVRGPEGIRSEVARWQSAWVDLDFDYEVVGATDEQVVIYINQTGTGRGSGAPMEMTYGQVFTVRDGSVVRMKTYLEREEAARAAGIDPSEPS
jgi:ketosteroid isomerase-like protein